MRNKLRIIWENKLKKKKFIAFIKMLKFLKIDLIK